MAQTGYTPISIYYSATASNTPTAGNLVAGELALNTADGKLFYKDSSNVVQVIGTKGGVGSSTTTQVLYNSSGLVVGSANLTFNGTTLTTANDASISGLTVGKGGGAVSSNTALGYNSLSNVSQSGTQNFAAGWQVLTGNTSGSNNVGTGAQTLFSNTTGSSNSGYGTNALPNNTTGSFNVAVGQQALNTNTTASNNTAVGYQAGYANTTGTYNTFIGNAAGVNSTAGNNTFVGMNAGLGVSTGTGNTFIGVVSGYGGAGQGMTTGSKNTILGGYSGNQGGLDIRTASNYIVLSDGDGNPRGVFDSTGNLFGAGANYGTGFQNVTSAQVEFPSGRFIANHSGTASGSFYAGFAYNGSGIGSITQAGTTGVLYNVTSDYRLKNDVTPIQNALATVEALNPVSFTWIDGRKDDGFLAHEIQAVIPNCVTGEKDAVNEDGTPKYQQMDNSGVIPFLVKAIQELNAKVTALEIATLKGQ